MISCASTGQKDEAQINDIAIYNVTLDQRKTVPNSECDALLDECAIVVEKQNTAIEEQKKVIDLQTEQVKIEQQAKQHAESAKNTWTVISIIQGVALTLLLLL